MLTEAATQSRLAQVPRGGRLTAIVEGLSVYDANPKNFTVIVLNSHGNELQRRVGNDHIPEPITPARWVGAIMVDLQEPISDSIFVYVVYNDSGHREEYEISRRDSVN
jgi:hypothetical protein